MTKRAILFFLLGLMLSGGALRAEMFSEGERLGKLRVGQSEKEVLKLLGQPETRGKAIEWEAIGEWVQEWRFPAIGLVLDMASEKKGGSRRILNITATGKCPLATARGIRIGSTETQVRQAYGKVEDKTQSLPGEVFVAGSIYGGVIFRFEDGKVFQIFIGAAAE